MTLWDFVGVGGLSVLVRSMMDKWTVRGFGFVGIVWVGWWGFWG